MGKMTGISKKLIVICGVAILANLAGGCAFGDRHVSFNSIDSNCIEKCCSNSTVNIPKPKDKRGKNTPGFVGYVKNGYGMHTADVICDRDIEKWIQECVHNNLNNAGFDVINKNTRHGISVNIDILKLECDCTGLLKAEVQLDTKLKNNGKTFYSNTFSATATKYTAWMSGSDYAETIKMAMRQCLSNMIPELISQIDQETQKDPSTQKTAAAPQTKETGSSSSPPSSSPPAKSDIVF